MTRKCITCSGSGFLWKTPDLTRSDVGGTGVTCWKCLGKGNVQDSYPNDSGEEL